MDSTNDNQGPPTQAEVEAIHRELTETDRHLAMLSTSGRRLCYQQYGLLGRLVDLNQRAAVMIARLERAWLEAKDSG